MSSHKVYFKSNIDIVGDHHITSYSTSIGSVCRTIATRANNLPSGTTIRQLLYNATALDALPGYGKTTEMIKRLT